MISIKARVAGMRKTIFGMLKAREDKKVQAMIFKITALKPKIAHPRETPTFFSGSFFLSSFTKIKASRKYQRLKKIATIITRMKMIMLKSPVKLFIRKRNAATRSEAITVKVHLKIQQVHLLVNIV